MHESTKKRLNQAYKKEKNAAIKERIQIVCLVKIDEYSITETAKICRCGLHTVTKWIQRFDEDDLAGLEDKSCSGRPPKVKLEKIKKIVASTNNITTPKELKNDIQKELKVKYHISNVRKIMNKMDMFPKTVQRIHINRPEIEEIKRWQRNAKRRISRLESKGCTVVALDEAIFTDNPAKSVKYWSLKGEPILTSYNGRHNKIVAYCSIATDSRQFIRSYDKFNKETFLKYLKALTNHFGKVAIIMDNTPQHKATKVENFLKENSCKVIWLPPATPELNAVEEYWHQSKNDVLVSEYYPTFDDMQYATSEYFRTARPKLDVMMFICRRSLIVKNF